MNTAANYQQPTYSIGVVARLTGLTAHNLRMWERRYGLAASLRSSNGRREFTKTDLDHLRLIKQLLDRGMRIGDIAKLPQKTLSGLCVRQPENATTDSSTAPTATAVVGHALTMHFDKHPRRYPQLALNCKPQSIEEWFSNTEQTDDIDADTGKPQVYLLQIDMVNQAIATQLRKLKQNDNSIFIFYRYAARDLVVDLENVGITMSNSKINTDTVDNIVKEALRQKSYSNLLEQSAEQFDLTLPSERPRQFNPQQLADAAKRSSELNCECPPHLSDLINALNAFEDYSQQCSADNWKEASVHACIYAYTCQARYLMEKALVAVLDD
jgi:DNA-binding transcriptional MerR regulator